MMDLVRRFTLYSFLLWVFTIRFFSYKVFNETMMDASTCVISCFPTGFFLEINQGMDYFLNLTGS
jgi:hypothetical protein